MKKAKTIKEIYEEARSLGVDVILTNDAALATAINAMIDEPRVGDFAMTPIQMASKHAVDILGETLYSEIKVIQTISEETGLDFRYVHGEVNRIREIARYREDIEQYLTPSSKMVYRSWSALPTLESAMRKFNSDNAAIYKDLKIGTIGAEYFDRLDRLMVPLDSVDLDIEPLKDEEYEIPCIYGIGNDRQLADNAVELIDPLNPADYAIVMNSDSSLADAVRSALYRNNLPFVNSLNVRDLNGIRDYLQFAERSLMYWTIRVRDVRSLFSSNRATVSHRSDMHLLHKENFRDEKAESLRLLMEEVSSYENGEGVTFLELAERLYSISGRRSRQGLSSIKILLDDLDINDEKITPQTVAKMRYAIDNVNELHHNEQIPEDEKRGVLLTDCKRSAYIDRPVVIYLGMEQDWNFDLVKKPYIPDIEDETAKVADRMSTLLQQGSARFYLVNRTKSGKAAVPTNIFNELIEPKSDSESDAESEPKRVEKFGDITERYEEMRWYASEERDSSRDIEDYDQKYTQPFSQSGFAKYFKCPRGFMYSTVMSTPDNASLGFGTMIHEFAEMYASYKKEVDSKGLDFFIDVSCERYSGLSTPLHEEIDRGRIRCALVNIRRFIDSVALGSPGDGEWKDVDDRYPNWYYENCFDAPKTETYRYCEEDYDSAKHRIHGKMDLVNGDTVFDFKTGGAKSGFDIAKSMDFEKPSDYPDFQSLFYLAIAYEMQDADTFTLFFAMDNDREYSDPGFDIGRNMRTVRLIDAKPEELLLERAVIDAFDKGTRSKNFKGRGEEFLRIVVENCVGDLESWSNPSAQKAAVDAISAAFYEKGMKKETYKTTVDRYVELLESPVIAGRTEVLVKKSHLEEFVDYVDGEHAKMVDMSNVSGGLESKPRMKCTDCEYFAVCTANPNEDETNEEGSA